LLASARAFSAFFALARANLLDFSALTLAAVAASKAFLEASSSASSDEMRALAIARASVVHQRGKKSQAKKQRKVYKTIKYRKNKFTLGGLSTFQILDTFIAQGDKFLHQVLSKKWNVSINTQKKEVNIPVCSCTSSEELVE
jgi:hypothetical protein